MASGATVSLACPGKTPPQQIANRKPQVDRLRLGGKVLRTQVLLERHEHRFHFHGAVAHESRDLGIVDQVRRDGYARQWCAQIVADRLERPGLFLQHRGDARLHGIHRTRKTAQIVRPAFLHRHDLSLPDRIGRIGQFTQGPRHDP